MADPFAADSIQVVVEDGNRPVPAQPVALPVQPVPVSHGGQQLQGANPLPGKWSSDCCDCCDDCIICCSVCCLGQVCPIGIAQLYQRYSMFDAQGRRTRKCRNFMALLTLCMVGSAVMYVLASVDLFAWMTRKIDACSGSLTYGAWGIPNGWRYNDAEECFSGPGAIPMIFYPASGLLLFITQITKCMTLTSVRKKIRTAHNIPPGCCGDCDDCCISCMFPACATCQMLRHTIKYAVMPQRPGYPTMKATYELCSEEGTEAPPPPELTEVKPAFGGMAGFQPQGGIAMTSMQPIPAVPAHVAQPVSQPVAMAGAALTFTAAPGPIGLTFAKDPAISPFFIITGNTGQLAGKLPALASGQMLALKSVNNLDLSKMGDVEEVANLLKSLAAFERSLEFVQIG